MAQLIVMAEHQHLLPRLPWHPPVRRPRAWILSIAIHLVALGLAVWLLQRAVVVPPSEPLRMVFVEPVAPPPPPLGAPASQPAAPVVPVPVVERPQVVTQPQRLMVPRPKAKPRPAPAAAVAPAGEAQGSVGGVVGGVVGGEAGGQVGGVVGGHGDAPIPADQVEHPPVVVSRVLPAYPPMARARSLEGRVLLRAVVDRDGRVEEAITIVESLPPFDEPAIEALRHWHFQPGRDRDGQTVRVLIDVPIRFQLR